MILKAAASALAVSSSPTSSSAAAAAASSMRPTAQKILANRSFDIEFQGYLSNHAKHAIIALDRLSAPSERVQEYWDAYTTLTPYNLPLHKLDEQSWLDLEDSKKSFLFTRDDFIAKRGKKESWQGMVNFLQQELKAEPGSSEEEKVDNLVREYAPGILDGMAGALTHGIIHLGWAIDARSSWMTLEGLAYLNFCHLPFGPDVSLASKHFQEDSPLQSLQRICGTWQDENLADDWIAQTKDRYDESFHPELVPAGFQWHLAKVLHDAHPIATELPTWLRTKSLSFDERGSVWESLYQTMTLVYLATKDGPNGNFLILHLITSLWGLEKVSRILMANEKCGLELDLDSEETVRQALEAYWAAAICLLATSTSGVPPFASIQKTADEFPFMSASDGLDYLWDDTVARGIAEEEEHNIKLVYVTRELWKRYGRWSGYSEAGKSFTLTPNIGPSSTSFKS